MKYFIGAVFIGIAIAVIAGFFVVGSPQKERLRRFDERRVQDLQTIQWSIISYWQSKRKLPSTLQDLRNDISGFVPPADPQTGEDYGYEVKGGTQFSLCASFILSNRSPAGMPKSTPPDDYYAGLQNWQHDAGRVCFNRVIDPDFYPVRPKEEPPPPPPSPPPPPPPRD